MHPTLRFIPGLLMLTLFGCPAGDANAPAKQNSQSTNAGADASGSDASESDTTPGLPPLRPINLAMASRHETNTDTLAARAEKALVACRKAISESVVAPPVLDPAPEPTEEKAGTVRPPGPTPQPPPGTATGPRGMSPEMMQKMRDRGMDPNKMTPEMKRKMMEKMRERGMDPRKMTPEMRERMMKQGGGGNPGMMPPGMQPPPGLRTRQNKPAEGANGEMGKDSGMPGSNEAAEDKPIYIPEPALSFDTGPILAACSTFGSLYLAHESELGKTYRFDQVLGKFARLGDDVNTLIAVAPMERKRATQEAALKNLTESMKVLEDALATWRKKDQLAKDAENVQGQPPAENWKGRSLRHVQNARAGRIDPGGSAPEDPQAYRKEIQRFLRNDEGGIGDLDRRINAYGLRSGDAPEQIRVLFMRYFGTIHMQRVDARIRRFTAPPSDATLASLHSQTMAYLTRTKALLEGYKAAEKAIHSEVIRDREKVDAIDANMKALQGEWASSFESLAAVLTPPSAEPKPEEPAPGPDTPTPVLGDGAPPAAPAPTSP